MEMRPGQISAKQVPLICVIRAGLVEEDEWL